MSCISIFSIDIKQILQESTEMSEKSLLISSMQKLTNHVKMCKTHQQQIFYSLSQDDFKKILANLDDDNPMLRKTSLNLIAQLITNNSKLKILFCKTMAISLLPGKVKLSLLKIVLNSRILQKVTIASQFGQLVRLLKRQTASGMVFCYEEEFDCLLWYINIHSKNHLLELQYLYKDSNKPINLDPQQCVFGFCLSQKDLTTQLSTTNLSIALTQSTQIQKRQDLKGLIQRNPKKTVSFIGSKINSSVSDVQPKYQRMNKSIQLDSDRPKKFINNFLNQRKNNPYKGNETQRYTTMNSSVNEHHFKRQSFDGQYSRPIMPIKQTPAPYIPSLDIDNSPNRIISNTDRGFQRISDHQTDRMNERITDRMTDRVPQRYTTINGSKQLDFQKIKYQGIKLMTNTPVASSNRSSFGINVSKNIDRRQVPIEQTFKYIKPMSTTHQQGVKLINFFHKRPQDTPNRQKKTIDVFQYIKNR